MAELCCADAFSDVYKRQRFLYPIFFMRRSSEKVLSRNPAWERFGRLPEKEDRSEATRNSASASLLLISKRKTALTVWALIWSFPLSFGSEPVSANLQMMSAAISRKLSMKSRAESPIRLKFILSASDPDRRHGGA